MFDKIKKMIEKWLDILDEFLEDGEYQQPSNNEPTTQYD